MSVQLTHKLRNPKNLSKWLDIWTADVTEEKDEDGKIIEGEYTYTIEPSSNWKIPVTYLDSDNSGDGDSTKFLNQKGEWTDVGYNLSIEEDSNPDSSSDTDSSDTESSSKTESFQSYNLKLTQNDNMNKEDIVNIKINNPIYSEFTEGTDDKNPSLSLSVNNITNKNIDEQADISVSKLDFNAQNAINNTIISKNEETQEVTSAINLDNASKVWTTDDVGNPGWRKISNQFNTKLFGAYIGWHKPTTIIIEEESSKSYTLSKPIENTDKEDTINGTLTGFYNYDKKYETMSVRLKGSFDITRWIIDGPAGGNESTESSTGDDPAGAPSIEPYPNSFVIENIESDSFPIQIEDKVLDLNWALDQWMGQEEFNQNYLKNMAYYDNLRQPLSDEDNKDFMNGLCREFLTVISDNENNENADFSSLEVWKENDHTLIECLSDWDYNHCGIWIET